MYHVLPQADQFNDASLRRLLQALQEATDARLASGTPPSLEQLWEQTRHLPGVLDAWRDIASYLEGAAPHGDTQAYYGYPQLRARIREAG